MISRVISGRQYDDDEIDDLNTRRSFVCEKMKTQREKLNRKSPCLAVFIEKPYILRDKNKK